MIANVSKFIVFYCSAYIFLLCLLSFISTGFACRHHFGLLTAGRLLQPQGFLCFCCDFSMCNHDEVVLSYQACSKRSKARVQRECCTAFQVTAHTFDPQTHSAAWLLTLVPVSATIAEEIPSARCGNPPDVEGQINSRAEPGSLRESSPRSF